MIIILTKYVMLHTRPRFQLTDSVVLDALFEKWVDHFLNLNLLDG